MPAQKRKNHYIPQFYLRNWSNDKKKVFCYQLLVSNNNVRKWDKKSISTIAVWPDLYTAFNGIDESDSFEQLLDKEIENPVKIVFDKVKKELTLSNDDLLPLLRYMAVQAYRTPAGFQRIMEIEKKSYPTILDELCGKLQDPNTLEEIKHTKPKPPPDSDLLPTKISLDRVNNVANIQTIIGRESSLFALKRVIESTYKVLLKHKWHIIHAAKGLEFPTSDDPVISLNYVDSNHYDFDGGWGVNNVCLFMPLTPQHLLFSQIGYYGSLPELDYSPEWTATFQKWIIEHASRLVISTSENKYVEKVRPRIVNQKMYRDEITQFTNWNKSQNDSILNLKK